MNLKNKYLYFLSFAFLGLFFLGCGTSATTIPLTLSTSRPITLPKNTQLRVTLEDVSLMDVPSTTIASYTDTITKLPLHLNFSYDSKLLQKGHTYNLRATIRHDTTQLYVTDAAHHITATTDTMHLELNAVTLKKLNTPCSFLETTTASQVDFLNEDVYIMKTNNSYDIGRYSYQDNNRKLILKGGRDAPLIFNRVNSLELHPNDVSKKEYFLSNTRTPLSPTLLMQGNYSYMADAALFQEKITQMRFPVAFEEDHIMLERTYLKAQKTAGAPLPVLLEGRLELRPKMEGEGKQYTLVVTRFIKLL